MTEKTHLNQFGTANPFTFPIFLVGDLVTAKKKQLTILFVVVAGVQSIPNLCSVTGIQYFVNAIPQAATTEICMSSNNNSKELNLQLTLHIEWEN